MEKITLFLNDTSFRYCSGDMNTGLLIAQYSVGVLGRWIPQSIFSTVQPFKSLGPFYALHMFFQ